MSKIKVALQVYSVRDDAARDFVGTIGKIAAFGYDGVELAGTYGLSPKRIAEVVNGNGMTCISAHVGYGELLQSETIAAYKAMGCKYVAIPHMTLDKIFMSDERDTVVENIKKIGKECKENGMQLLYHNHDFEFTKLEDGTYILDKLYELVPPEYLMPEFDTCWVKVAGEDPVAYINKYSGKTPVVHLKDFVGSKSANMYELIGVDKKADTPAEKFAFRPVGHGVQDFPSIIDASIKSGAEWVVVEQDMSYNSAPLTDAKKSREYLKSIGY